VKAWWDSALRCCLTELDGVEEEWFTEAEGRRTGTGAMVKEGEESE
jgi:hypothetical protein